MLYRYLFCLEGEDLQFALDFDVLVDNHGPNLNVIK